MVSQTVYRIGTGRQRPRTELLLKLRFLHVDLLLRVGQNALERLDTLVPREQLALGNGHVLLERRVLLNQLQKRPSAIRPRLKYMLGNKPVVAQG
jgi:hypothetical protein